MERNYECNEFEINDYANNSNTQEILESIKFSLASLYNTINDIPFCNYKKQLCDCIENLNIDFENCGIKILYHYKENKPNTLQNLRIIQCEPTHHCCDNEKIKSFSVGFEMNNKTISEWAIKYVYNKSNEKYAIDYILIDKNKVYISKEIEDFFDEQEIQFKNKKKTNVFTINKIYKTLDQRQIKIVQKKEDSIIKLNMLVRNKKVHKSSWQAYEKLNFVEKEN